MSKTQLITFTPSDAFFFGGASTFGNGKKRNFYAASNTFPQQTTLVGVLRHALYEAGHADDIGKSFKVNEKPDFGFLETISPVFLYKKATAEEPATYGLPVQLPNNEAGESVAIECQPVSNVQVDFGTGWQAAFSVKDYKEKHGISHKIVFTSSENPVKDYEDVFEEVTKTGIGRNRKTHLTTDGMFYQQTLFKLKEGYAFGALVSGKEELFVAVAQRNMPMGGEQKNFVLATQTIDKNFEQIFHATVKKHCLQQSTDWCLLTTDAYVSSNIYEKCKAVISDTQAFRNIITPNSKNYTAALVNAKDGDKRYKSAQFTLLKRGTVLFPKTDLATLTSALDNPHFEKIGYNHYFTNLKTN